MVCCYAKGTFRPYQLRGTYLHNLVFTHPLTFATQLRFGRIGTCNFELAMNSCPTILCLVADACFLEGSELPLFKGWLLLSQPPAKNALKFYIFAYR